MVAEPSCTFHAAVGYNGEPPPGAANDERRAQR
jgi:hypothetical protein